MRERFPTEQSARAAARILQHLRAAEVLLTRATGSLPQLGREVREQVHEDLVQLRARARVIREDLDAKLAPDVAVFIERRPDLEHQLRHPVVTVDPEIALPPRGGAASKRKR